MTEAYELTIQIAKTGKVLRRAVAVSMASFGCQPPQDLVLDALAQRDGYTPGELAKHLGVSGPTAVKMAQRLEVNGLVVRRRDDPDERLVRIYLTERGREVQGPIATATDAVAQLAVTGLSERDKQTLEKALSAVRKNLAQYDRSQ
jgi:MarR family transcriptional regulator, organic hydroperoxide resistance regulator